MNRSHALATAVLLIVLGASYLDAQNPNQQNLAPPNAPPSNLGTAQAPSTTAVQPPYPMNQAPPRATSNVPLIPPASWSPADEKPAPPEWQIYQHYFMHLGSLEQAAEQEDQRLGQSGVSPWRTHEERTLGLTAEEGKILNAVALDCNRELQFLDQKLAPIRDAYWNQPVSKQKRGQQKRSFAPPPEYMHVWDQKTQSVQNHIAQLKSSLSDATFQKLDRYVKWNFGGRTTYATNTITYAPLPVPQRAPEPARAVPQPGASPSTAPAATVQLTSSQPQPVANAATESASDQPAMSDQASDSQSQNEDQNQNDDREDPLTVRAGDTLPCPVDDADHITVHDQQRFLTVDGAGNVYFTADLCVFRLDPSGMVTRVAGGGSPKLPPYGPATAVFIGYPHGLATAPDDSLFIALNGQIVVVTPGGTLMPFILPCGRGWPPCAPYQSELFDPEGISSDRSGNLYVADTMNSRVAKISNGMISFMNISASSGYSSDGSPTAPTSLSGPMDVAVDSAGNLYIADTGNHRIVEAVGGNAITIAGAQAADSGSFAEGIPALLASLAWPAAVAVDQSGGVYIADTPTDHVRKVIPQGFINTWVDFTGIGYRGNFVNSNHNPTFEALSTDAQGNLYVYDDRNEQIAKVSSLGEVSIVARTVTTARK